MKHICGMSGRGRVIAWAAASLTTGLMAAICGTAPVSAALTTSRAATATRPAAGVAGLLVGVACAGASNCVAVGERSGTSHNPGGTLAERWNGTNWSVVTSPNPPQSYDARLGGIACTPGGNCIAVGNYYLSSSHSSRAIAERWNGTTWSILTVPSPPGSTNASLDAISCASATDCQAVGGSMKHTLAERWNGTNWTIEPSPSPNPAKSQALTGVSCASASLCWAVGYWYPVNTTGTGTLAEKWNGARWSVVTVPTSRGDQLTRDSCFAAPACMSVGISYKAAIAQRWTGATWVTTSPVQPPGATNAGLNAVSCPARSTCESVGYEDRPSQASAPLAERWTGTAWKLQATPAIGGSALAALYGIACSATANCWAVGSSISSSGFSPLIEHWRGRVWSLG